MQRKQSKLKGLSDKKASVLDDYTSEDTELARSLYQVSLNQKGEFWLSSQKNWQLTSSNPERACSLSQNSQDSIDSANLQQFFFEADSQNASSPLGL